MPGWLDGAATGATAGATVGGPWGAAIGGVVGGLGGFLGGGGGTDTSGSTTLTPYGDHYGMIDAQLNQATQSFNRYSGPEGGYAVDYWNNMGNLSAGAGGGGGGGGGFQPIAAGGGGGGGGISLPFASMSFGGGGGKDLSSIYAKPDEYLQKVLDGYWLDRGNPHVNELLSKQRAQGAKSLASGLGALSGSASQVGGTGGASAAMQKAIAASEFTGQQGLNEAQTLTGIYEAERGRMMSGIGMLGDQTMALRGNEAAIQQSKIGAAAQKYASTASAYASMFGAKQSAAASRYGSALGFNASLANNATTRRGQSLDYKLGLGQLGLGQFDRALALDNAIGAGRAGGFELASGYGNAVNPLLTGFGTTNTTSSTTQQYDPWAGLAQGVVGGSLAGFGIGNNYGRPIGQGGAEVAPAVAPAGGAGGMWGSWR